MVFSFLFILINFHRATQRAYPCFNLIFDWSPFDSCSTQLRYHGGWPLVIRNRNWIGNGIFLSQFTLQTMWSCTFLHEALCFVLKKKIWDLWKLLLSGYACCSNVYCRDCTKSDKRHAHFSEGVLYCSWDACKCILVFLSIYHPFSNLLDFLFICICAAWLYSRQSLCGSGFRLALYVCHQYTIMPHNGSRNVLVTLVT